MPLTCILGKINVRTSVWELIQRGKQQKNVTSTLRTYTALTVKERSSCFAMFPMNGVVSQSPYLNLIEMWQQDLKLEILPLKWSARRQVLHVSHLQSSLSCASLFLAW